MRVSKWIVKGEETSNRIKKITFRVTGDTNAKIIVILSSNVAYKIQRTSQAFFCCSPTIWKQINYFFPNYSIYHHATEPCPAGGSPRRAKILTIPDSLHPSNALSILLVSMFVHVRCMFGLHSYSFRVFLQRSKVKSEVLPPAPQVKSTKTGLCAFNLFNTWNKLSIPTSVFGGKNSSQYNFWRKKVVVN